MQCPYCKWTKSTVVDTYRLTVEVVRIRRCNRCKNYWETVERVERKVSPEAKANERMQMNIFEATGVERKDGGNDDKGIDDNEED